MADIRLYMLQTGSVRCPLHAVKMNQGDAPIEVPVPFFVLVHPKGVAVLDGGFAQEAIADPVGYLGPVAATLRPAIAAGEDCVSQLRRLGIAPQDVRWVILSHLHLDHSGAIGRFPRAVHVVQGAEYEYAFAPDWFAAPAYCRKDFDRTGMHWHLLRGAGDDMFDVYGDGTLRLIFTPGHSVGHQSFLVTLPETGSLLLAADAAYTRDHWEERALPGLLASAVDTVRSVQKLHMIAEQSNARVVTGHDPDDWRTLRKAPAFYE